MFACFGFGRDPKAVAASQLKKDGLFYRKVYFVRHGCFRFETQFQVQNSTKAHTQLLQTLQANDCREMITAVVDGDDLADVFAWAGNFNHADILEAFLNHGMNVDVKDKDGYTAFTIASSKGHEKCVRLLLDHNASVVVQDKNGSTALIWASQYGNTKIVEMLLEKNANPNIPDNDGLTALMSASRFGKKETVQVLLNHGADIE